MQSIKILLFIFKCTFLAFGGGNALFPIIRKEAVKKHKWLTEEEFDKLIIATNMIPGPSVLEALSYISMKVLGNFKGIIIVLIGVFPHLMFAFLIFFLFQKYLPQKYLFVINVSVMPVIIGILLAFAWRFWKISYNQMTLPWIIALIILTMSFCLFIPKPWNIPAIVMVLVILITLIVSYYKSKWKHK